MADSPNVWNEFAKELFQFFSNNMWQILLLVVLVIFRHSISDLLRRITNFTFKTKEAEVGVTAPHIPVIEEKSMEKILQDEPSDKRIEEEKEKNEIEKGEENWFINMNHAFNEGRIDDAKSIFEEYYAQETNNQLKDQQKTFYLYLLYIKGQDKEAIPRLENMAKIASDEAAKVNALFWLSSCYESSNSHEKAINLWKDTLNEIESSKLKTRCTEYLANALEADGQPKEALIVLEQRLQEITSTEEKLTIFNALARIEKKLGNNLMFAFCKEKVVELNPDSTDYLFDAAYAESETSLRALSIRNYDTLLNLDGENDAALNNLGVCAAEFKLNLKAFEYYSKSMELGNTLATANLGYKLLEAGFYKDAEKYTKNALENEEPHSNIHSLITRINETKKDESNKWMSIIEKANVFQKRVRKYTDAYYAEYEGSDALCAGIWYTVDGIEVTVILNGNQFSAKYIVTRGLTLTKFEITLKGTYKNATARVTYHKKPLEDKTSSGLFSVPTLLGRPAPETKNSLSFLESSSEWYLFSENSDDDFEMRLFREKPKIELDS